MQKNVMHKVLVTLMLFFASTVTAWAAGADDIIGVWKTKEGKSHVTVSKDGNKYVGNISWLKEPNGKDGKPVTDKNNPDEDNHNRPILGLQILSDLEFDDGEWEDGEIYDPKTGKTYNCKAWLEGGKLKLRGFIGFALLGQTTEWTPVK